MGFYQISKLSLKCRRKSPKSQDIRAKDGRDRKRKNIAQRNSDIIIIFATRRFLLLHSAQTSSWCVHVIYLIFFNTELVSAAHLSRFYFFFIQISYPVYTRNQYNRVYYIEYYMQPPWSDLSTIIVYRYWYIIYV